ncbi:urea transporter [Paraprevotella xylaniphila YIT 11841]|uniref:Urea transporter n=1 Tax=Paraprevotella xylaniphila YIT 11841 TaxID=762982 RepID=F3QW61_9BACT|nr:urea transporter [Paraprevotella xylaniphila]EGG52249.1 urea transporter [Paraprevotella xylaniphila YIT 11841]
MQEGFLIVGRGLGQVMFQNNAVSGLLMLVGIACNSWLLALLALLGNFVGTVTAFFSGYSKEDIEDGLYGFNGTLVGIAVGVFMEPGVASLLLLVAGSMLSTWIARVFAYQKLLPGFTAPFILAVWLLQALCRGWFPSLLSSSVMPEETAADWFRAFSLNIGQVMFQGGTVLSGLFFLAGILLNSRVHALYTVWGALLPLGMVWMVGSDYAAFNAGLLGYNAVLCAIALGDRSWAGAAWATLSVTLSVLLQVWGMSLGMTTLTAPFVVSVWLVSGMRRALCRK